MRIRFLLIITVTIIISSCSAPKFTLKHIGDEAEVKLKNKSTFTGEFLFINSDNIYLLLNETQSSNPYAPKKDYISTIKVSQIESMTINGYSDRSWGPSLVVWQVVPAIILAGVGASVDGENFAPVLGVGLVPVFLTWLLFEGSTPSSPSFESFMEQETLKDLKKYSRFPQGLTDSQIEKLLKIHDQKEIREIN